MTELLADLRRQIESLKEKDLYRTLSTPSGVDFSSNDYLGLSASTDFADRIAKRMVASCLTSPASRLLRGNTDYHVGLERRLARFKGTEAALLFNSGYQANLGLLSAVIAKRDRVLTDALNHASLIDGIRLSRASKVIYPHRDVRAVKVALRTPHRTGRTFIVTESMFSMDGDSAPLDQYAELAELHDAHLIVDDAHATGVFGNERGSGLVEQYGVVDRVFATVSTFGKALGAAGAVVSGSSTLIEFLINRCRPFIFTTAPPPLLLFAVDVALDIMQEHPELRERVMTLSNALRNELIQHNVKMAEGAGPIVPVVVGDPERAMLVAKGIQDAGYDVRAIRPPTVPPGTSRLRISVHANHTEHQVCELATLVSNVMKQACP